jgi:hypothetical protein
MRFAIACLGILASCLNAVVCAQTKCEAGSCVYNFSKPQEGFWPDWREVSATTINYLNVVKGAGFLNVESHGATFYQDNHAHLWWTSVGHGWTEASAKIRFTGDNGRVGYIRKWTDGVHGPEDCLALEHAPQVSDGALILTLYDDGWSYIGAFLGDLLPLGENIAPTESDPPQAFGVLGIVQLVTSASGGPIPKVLAYTVGEPIKMGGKSLDLALSVSPSWMVTVTGTMTGKGDVYEVTAQAKPPNIRGGVGVVGVTGARPNCIYMDGGEFSRQFEVSRIEVR